jgi:hypothetical protein
MSASDEAVVARVVEGSRKQHENTLIQKLLLQETKTPRLAGCDTSNSMRTISQAPQTICFQ